MRRWRLNSGYCGTTDQRRTKAGTIPALKHYIERDLGFFSTGWTPEQISTVVWLDASNTLSITLSGTSVTQWNDISGNNRNVSQSTGLNQPTYSATGFNGYPTISFDGSNDSLSFGGGGVAQSSGQNVFAVIDTTNIGTGYRIFMNRSNGSAPAFYLATAANNYRPLVYWGADRATWGSAIQTRAIFRWAIYTSPSTSTLVQVNGNTAVTASSATSTLANWTDINNSSVQQSNISISEIVITASDLATDARQQMEGYLAWKWGLQGSLPAGHPYISAAP